MSSASTPLPDVSSLVIGILGGSGPQGGGLAVRFAMAGHQVLVGSRSAERGREAAAKLAASGRNISGGDNADVAERADVVIVAVPWEGHGELLADLRKQLAGKIVIDCVNPMGFDKGGAFALPVAEGSAAQQAAAVLADSTVVGAFHHVSAVLLMDESVESIDTDILVIGDDRSATDTVIALANRITGMRGIYAGKLRNAGQVEALTANLISVNRRYKAHAGLRVTDV
ncbi:8-hydroxy-5-deazaflavin:NADPH oxidoreductase [Frankia sp. Hr75.2]|uniref:NADPH-dependent F420 reductase n=1 Tax=Parafrankia TaxID=2994362 RepID=UPI0000543D37|nr:NADPH-dependent F420 reductase [Parafrankia soli]ABW11198.1 NADPH-dependent F420 reductase [Frankia sp. EAN1pec]CAI7978252.1 8-hydroxy-5-deazaflavin:NADPH oxidoreductase [Frankia sp. Hr75.2]